MNTTETITKSKTKTLISPQLDPDFYHLGDILSDDEKSKVQEVREHMRTKVAPLVTK